MPTADLHRDPLDSPQALAWALERVGYLADVGLSTAAFLALRLHRPIFLEGEAGVGKTAFAEALAETTGQELIRLQCYEGLDAAQALYDWDFPRQILHLRAVEAARHADAADPRAVEAARHADAADPRSLEDGLYDRRFLIARPLLRALESAPCVLLVDELDRADDEFEAYLLELFADWAVSIPELGRVRARTPPTVVVTSNRTREVHDALKRRCLYHWIDHPDLDREVAILRLRLPDLAERLAVEVAAATARLRAADLVKPPGVAEAIDWAQALRELGSNGLTPELASATLGAVLKVREDTDRIRGRLDAVLVEAAALTEAYAGER
ncbi:MAG TPA: MoxR family ATPase [Micromonosporaceae bacterium]|nr:MoxR family ATPase [Micromonosporaceae bacterium]